MKEQLPTIQTLNPKIDEYVERIKGGADKESVLQGLPPSWIAAVEGKLGSKIEVTEQVVDSEIVTQQKEKKNKKVQKEAAKKMMEMGGGLSGLLGGLGK